VCAIASENFAPASTYISRIYRVGARAMRQVEIAMKLGRRKLN